MIIEDLGSFKRVAPLCLRFCRGAPFFNIAEVRLVYLVYLVCLVNETNQMKQIHQINKINQTDLGLPRRAGHQSSAV